VINKKNVQHNFNNKATIYNDCALIQKTAAKKLCDLAKDYINDDVTILDLGSGTSFIAKNLLLFQKNLKIFEVDFAKKMLDHWQDRPKNVTPILADIENLPFKNNETFDIIFSSFALQWIDNFEQLFTNLYSLLKQNGLIIFCLPTEKTFAEIRDANKKSGCNFSIRNLANQASIRQSLLDIGFKENFFISEIVNQKYQNAAESLKEFKKIGTNYSENSKTIITKKNLQKFNLFFSQNSNNIASWHLCYLIFKK